ncbi:MAG: acetate--CoA ligase [Thaumarchaeota archaeon]|nr:acetate--CoA ligase [Candidatus Calditenuaceae archaeon]MDW8041545.1 acetate--CoA ligase [Nitrososphaerota archaeon]
MSEVIAAHRRVWEESLRDPEKFWAGVASELEWFRSWDVTLDDTDPPFYRWFVGGRTNICFNCLDRNVKAGKANKVALIWVGSDRQVRQLTYRDLLREVTEFSAALKSLGLKKGDRVTVYMPMIPEAMVAMLSVARLGAVHSVVFSGFGVQALADRIIDSQSRFVVTADAMFRRGKVIHLKEVVDEAATRSGCVEGVIVVKRAGIDVKVNRSTDYWYHDLLSEVGKVACVEPEQLRSEEPLFILYTSGTTGKPKGVLHLHGQYMVWAYAHNKWLFSWGDNDVFFSTPDIGWINGHSYSTYGPLLNGATVLWYEDAPDHPHPGIWWEIVDRYEVTSMWVAPTAVRLLMRYGDEVPGRYSLRSLGILVSAGEILGEEVWKWLRRNVAKQRDDCHVIETWGQTENSGFIAAPGGFGIAKGIAYRPGSVGLPYPGIRIGVVDDSGRVLGAGERGNVVVYPPTPPAFMFTIWGDPERYVGTYWKKFGAYLTGDYGYIDAEGYVYILGRVDDVVKVAGHRLAPADVENVAYRHPAVAECAVVSVPDPVKGEALVVLITPKVGLSVDKERLAEEVRELVRREMGAVAVVEKVFVVERLPKTRTGKIMRRVVRAVLTGIEPGDLSTLEDEASVMEVLEASRSLERELSGRR